MYWNAYKTKRENQNITKEYRYFIESNIVEVNKMFALIYPNQDGRVKRFNGKKYYLPKSIIKNYNVIINGKNF